MSLIAKIEFKLKLIVVEPNLTFELFDLGYHREVDNIKGMLDIKWRDQHPESIIRGIKLELNFK